LRAPYGPETGAPAPVGVLHNPVDAEGALYAVKDSLTACIPGGGGGACCIPLVLHAGLVG
jgi:hypothetical protein